MTDREAIRQALDTPYRQYSIKPHGNGYAIYRGRDLFHHGFNIGHLTEVTPATVKLIEDALNATLAQPEQEPEAWMGITDNPYCDDADCNDLNGRAMRWHKKLLYLRKQEYTAPVSKPKEWISLTDDEINEAAIKCVKSGQSVNAAIRAIEAALRSKNDPTSN